MTQFVKLTHGNGDAVWINPAHVATVRSDHRVPGGAEIHLAVVQNIPDDSSDLYRVFVTEAPERVVGALERALLVVPPR